MEGVIICFGVTEPEILYTNLQVHTNEFKSSNTPLRFYSLVSLKQDSITSQLSEQIKQRLLKIVFRKNVSEI